MLFLLWTVKVWCNEGEKPVRKELLLNSSLTAGGPLASVRLHVNFVPPSSSLPQPQQILRHLSSHEGKQPCLKMMHLTPRLGEQSENRYREFYLKVRECPFSCFIFPGSDHYINKSQERFLLYINYKKHQDFLIQEEKANKEFKYHLVQH